jgi:hypothetical protein
MQKLAKSSASRTLASQNFAIGMKYPSPAAVTGHGSNPGKPWARHAACIEGDEVRHYPTFPE